jgi:hypothetical protein
MNGLRKTTVMIARRRVEIRKSGLSNTEDEFIKKTANEEPWFLQLVKENEP